MSASIYTVCLSFVSMRAVACSSVWVWIAVMGMHTQLRQSERASLIVAS